jgi:hypothetical protein
MIFLYYYYLAPGPAAGAAGLLCCRIHGCSSTWHKSVHNLVASSVVDPHHVDADPESTYHPDAYPDSDFLFDPHPDPDPSFKKKAQTLLKVLKSAHIPDIFAWHLQIVADPVPGPA